MSDPLTWLAALTLGLILVALVELVWGARRLTDILDLELPARLPWPPVSVVVAARDEATQVEAAMRTLLALDYPDLEVIAIDDRSTDGTGTILDRLAASDARLRVVHVEQLPARWLGKNHALHTGAAQARGEFLLFTDADVHLGAGVLQRSIALMQRDALDHLVLGPTTTGGGPLLRVLLATFSLCFSLAIRPWRTEQPGRSEHVGIGAFNLVRRSALQAVGGFGRIRMRPDDDLRLGRLLREHGLRQRFVAGAGLVCVEWYPSTWQMVRGLEKNSFAFLDYSVSRTVAACALLLVTGVWPWLALALTGGVALWCNAATVVLTASMASAAAVRTRCAPVWAGLAFPLGATLLTVITLNSMIRTLVRGGIEWRGTFYPLAGLRADPD